MMGGAVSHEFMLLTDIGEDTLVICPECDYKSNMEVAKCMPEAYPAEEPGAIEEVYTGDAKEISEVTAYLGDIPAEKTVKAVCYNIKGDAVRTVLCFIRGDLEVNEAKLKKIVRAEVVPANLNDSALVAGNIGPVGLDAENVTVVIDASLKGAVNMVTGANKEGYHLKNVCEGRDFKASDADIAKVKEGARCPVCGAPLTVKNGIEIGNIFQLGTKYTASMGMTVLNKEGKAVNPIMGCYGIGIGRAIASIAEERADEKGLNWPMSVAPWHVYLCALRVDDAQVREKAEALYNEMQAAGIEVIYDDREASPGFKFSDCDLMGIPLRVVVSPRSLAAGEVELQIRESGERFNMPYAGCVAELKKTITERKRI